MNNYKKYIKYKTKYLKLKKNLNNTQVGGRKVKTISNGGSDENMINQCFWISILDYLNRHDHPNLTLHELRTDAGLDYTTEHTMFDVDYLVGPPLDRKPIFLNAAVQVATIYYLTIQVFTVDHNGNIIESAIASGGVRATIGTGPNRVNIAQFGLGHFELIVDNGGADFVPLVSVMGKLKKIIEIPKERQNMYLQNSEDTLLLKDLEYQLKILSEENLKKQQTQQDDKSFLEYTQKYSDLDTLIREIKERIKKEELEIKGFRVLDKIDEFEKLNKDIRLLQNQQLAIQSSLRGEKTKAIDSVIAQIDENFSKEIELFKLQDMLQEQTKCLIDEQQTYNLLHTEDQKAYKGKLESLAKTIQEIKKSITQIETNIVKKKRELDI